MQYCVPFDFLLLSDYAHAQKSQGNLQMDGAPVPTDKGSFWFVATVPDAMYSKVCVRVMAGWLSPSAKPSSNVCRHQVQSLLGWSKPDWLGSGANMTTSNKWTRSTHKR